MDWIEDLTILDLAWNTKPAFAASAVSAA